MKIVYYHRIRGTGADGTHIKGVIKGFETLGHQVFISSPGTLPDNTAKAKNTKKTFLLDLPRVVFELLELLYNIPAFFKLLRGYLRNKYDLIYERYSFLNFSGFLMSWMTTTPLLLEVNFTTKTQVYPKRTKVFISLTRWLEKIHFKRARLIIVVSEVLKNEIADQGIASSKILVLPNAVDIELFRPKDPSEILKAQYAIDKNEKIIGFVGSFYPWHGVDFLIDTYEEILKEYNNVSLMLLGDGQMSEQLKKHVREIGLEKKVIFTGRVPHDILPEYIALFDIGIMPDSNDYGSPMKIFEYMAMEKPIVAPKLKPIEEVIENGHEGVLFARRNNAELEEALLRLLNNAEVCRSMGKEGRAKVLRRHTWELNVKKMIEHYRNIN